MIRTGQVIAREKQGLLVCFERLAACESCKACGRDRQDTSVHVAGDAQVGDTVQVEMPEAKVLKASLITYLLPLAGLLLGLLLGSLIAPGQDLVLVGLGLLGMALCLVGVRLLDSRLRHQQAWKPRIVGVLPKDPENDEELLPEGQP